MPIVLRVELELGEEVRAALLDHSTIHDIDNELFSVSETSVVQDGCLRISREIMLRRGLVEGELIELVPALTEAVARASGMTLQFDGRVYEVAGEAQG